MAAEYVFGGGGECDTRCSGGEVEVDVGGDELVGQMRIQCLQRMMVVACARHVLF
jgi:hypothetical protein